MTDVRCPMCGKSNPPDAEVCQFCEARIKPLAASGANSEHLDSPQTGPAVPPVPDWLRSFREEQPTDFETGEESQDWFGGGSESEQGGVGEEAGQADEKSQDWLSRLMPETPVNPQPEPEPDWMREPESGLKTEQQPEPEEAPQPATGGAEEYPTWLASADEPKPEEQEPELSAQEPAEAGLEAASVPELLPEAELPAPELGDLPEWLTKGSPELNELEQPQEPEQKGSEEEGLAPAELPGWLEAMRPVETAAPSAPLPDNQNRSAQGSGPLSGLNGILPAEPELARQKKASAYSGKVQISDSQQAHADVLEALIREEGAAQPIPVQPSASPNVVLRPLIFLVLFFGIGWMVFTGSQDTQPPALAPEAFAVNTAINSLQPGTPVLLAVDYQPALSAEMDAVSSAVVDHLMQKGVYLTLVSTLPTGPAQGERLVKNVSTRGGYDYQDIQQYANLGFIPGGPAGLLSFAETPQLTTPFAMDGSFVWEKAPLQKVSRLADFGLVMVLTEDADTARSWIEQVQPVLGATPLLMVISAQAEPLVRPYYEGNPKQVQGMVVGLAGGASYERALNHPGSARKYWDSYSLALLLSAGLIVLLGAANVISNQVEVRRKAKRETAA